MGVNIDEGSDQAQPIDGQSIVRVATESDKEHNTFVLQARQTKSMYFCPPEMHIPTSDQLEILGVGDVEVTDKRQVIITHRNGIYAKEVGSDGKAKPVYILPDEIRVTMPRGLEALKAIHAMLKEAMNQSTVPFGLKGSYLSQAECTLAHVSQLPDRTP